MESIELHFFFLYLFSLAEIYVWQWVHVEKYVSPAS